MVVIRRREMPISLNWNAVARRVFQAWVVLILAATWFAGPARSQEASKNGKIYVVTHVDSVPTQVASSTKLLQQYAADTRKETGALRAEVLIQISRPNHFTIVEVWQDKQAYDAHEAAAHTKKFREEIMPFLGSPFDERLHQLME
jgi:quinol monooxygenase YgiN